MIAKRMQDKSLAVSPIRRASETALRLKEEFGEENVYDFTIGNPGALPPKEVSEAIRALLDEDQHLLHSYMQDAGFPEVRADIASNLNRRFNLSLTQDNIIMTVGAAGAMNIAMCALVDPDDEIIVMRPYYPGYTTFFRVWDAVKVEVDAVPSTLQPDMNDLRAKITERTKMVIVNSPNNPSGAIYTQETAEKIAAILNEAQEKYGHDIYLLSDEPYRELVYTDAKLPVWMNVYQNTLMAYSFSKSLSIPGDRIGYLAIPSAMNDSKAITAAARQALGMIGFVNAPAMFQRVVQRCLDCTIDMEYYTRNRNLLYESLTSYGFKIVKPEGAFYLFIEAPDGDETRLMQAFEDNNVVLVEGSAFGMPGYARLSFCISIEVVQAALPHLRAAAVQLGLCE
jgi:aspartate aminotransferase